MLHSIKSPLMCVYIVCVCVWLYLLHPLSVHSAECMYYFSFCSLHIAMGILVRLMNNINCFLLILQAQVLESVALFHIILTQ